MSAKEMSRDEADLLLRQKGAGVLSLTDTRETYAIPESFGYDGEALYFQFVTTPDSRKLAFLETTEVATFTVFTESSPARSVVVRGRLERVPDDETMRATEALADNAFFPTWDTTPPCDDDPVSFDYYRLCPRKISGRAFGESL